MLQGMCDAADEGGTEQQKVQLREQMTLATRFSDLRMDIITVRSRVWKRSPKLSDILKALWANGYKYEEVHCNFCRGGGTAYAPEKIAL